ncbi:hypothetical protein KBZ10_22140 [Streptomyces sp. F63]|uniref:hypothetical protein n=1 Tax=Streptomyces sp. F63 TaxID=2824887 RepID=UPI001B381ADC|nr:hypothetical protein [Streptomyces sp. F63]MBQ0987166.1 hypothetical protein [Streptomyces sp. F63]
MLDTTPLETAVDRLADRLRAAPQSRLRRGAAAQGLELARELAVRAQRIEFPEREPLVMPEAGLFTVADQVAVAGHDLAAALRGADGGRGEAGTGAGGTAGEGGTGAAGLAGAVALVRTAAERCGC